MQSFFFGIDNALVYGFVDAQDIDKPVELKVSLKIPIV
jgi:hypothetical protein